MINCSQSKLACDLKRWKNYMYYTPHEFFKEIVLHVGIMSNTSSIIPESHN